MWHDLVVALALVLVIEGIMPFLNPNSLRNLLSVISKMDDRSIRIGGLTSMIVGVALLHFFR